MDKKSRGDEKEEVGKRSFTSIRVHLSLGRCFPFIQGNTILEPLVESDAMIIIIIILLYH